MLCSVVTPHRDTNTHTSAASKEQNKSSLNKYLNNSSSYKDSDTLNTKYYMFKQRSNSVKY